jgi:hypothetical protein
MEVKRMNKRYLNVTFADAENAIKAYNSEIYVKTGRKNVDIDAEGIDKFKTGLGMTLSTIEEQIRWIGKDYGGTAFMLALTRLPSIIANDIYSMRAEYVRKISSSEPLIHHIPDRSVVVSLYRPFIQVLQTPAGKQMKNWMTWATKFWHFLNPNVFPIMDSHAKKFFKIPSNIEVVDAYMELLRRLHQLLIERFDWLTQLRQADKGHAGSDIKLWDKVAYQLGQ